MNAALEYIERVDSRTHVAGHYFCARKSSNIGSAQNPYVAVMSCPRCGTMGLITRRQLVGSEII